MGKGPNLSTRHAEIMQLAKSGLVATGIAALIGACPSGVRKYCRRNGIPLVADRDRIMQCEAEFLAAAAETPHAPELAAKFGVSPQTIRSWAKRVGVKLYDKFHKGFVITHNGYKLVRAPSHPNCTSAGYVREHVLVMEAHLGRYLVAGECVHHKDRDKLNNALENLELLSLEEHAALHAKEGETGWAAYHRHNKI